jgi:hypothetical protein
MSPWIPGALSSDASTSTAGCPPQPSAISTQPFREPTTGPTGQPAPEQIVACVGSQAITGATYRHWEIIAESDAEPSPKHRPSASELTNQVLGFLISSDWVIGEASALHIHVPAAAVRRKFNHLRKQQFPRRSDFEAFLRHTQQTLADLELRVELNILSERIQRHVIAGHRDARGKQNALSHFVQTFKTRWTAQTYCQAEYVISDCGYMLAAT